MVSEHIEIKKLMDFYHYMMNVYMHSLPTHISIQSTCKSACTIIWPL